MSKIIIVSNRLPIAIKKKDGAFEYEKSIGGLATGLKSVHENADTLWIGWLGFPDEQLNEEEMECVKKELFDTYRCIPVFLSEEEIDLFYYGFCNKTIWPLFHYFLDKTEYNFTTWEAYKKVNQKFSDVVKDIACDGDIIWIHDYQLMLLPKILKEQYPNARIGYFHHIPFPSHEIFRLLIWREEILQGLLGADLIGFHTYDYVRHFLISTRRILGLENNLHRIRCEDRYVYVDVFPMGIDYDWFAKEHDKQNFQLEAQELAASAKGVKTILSIDRLDYTKGIPERIRAFDRFLSANPEYQGKVRMNLIVAPSRTGVDSYDDLRKEITERVSEVNGKYATVNWMPIWYFFQSFTQESLICFYRSSDVMLVTPLRDGMNLVAKEYIASRRDYEGMLVVSETAGVASELGEAVIVNPNDLYAIAAGIKTALEMPVEEKILRNRIMRHRLERYNVNVWASEFLRILNLAASNSIPENLLNNIENDSGIIKNAYKESSKRAIFLDYDGTLVGFRPVPEQAKPDSELYQLLQSLTNDSKNTIAIISGRDKNFLDTWFGQLDLYLIAAHGLWIRKPHQKWKKTLSMNLNNKWKESVKKMLDIYTARVPGSFVEEKDFSIAWHYRQCDPDLLEFRLTEIREALIEMIQSMPLEIQEGNKVLEVKDSRINKGYGASIITQSQQFDFILSAGDDYTDENMFLALPENAYTIKIGTENTNAKYRLKSWESLRRLLKKLVDKS